MSRNLTSHARRPRKTGGFTMIELVIVVVIIGIIAAIAIPRMSRGSAAAADSATLQNLQILRTAIETFQTEHQGVFPVASGSVTVADLLTKYSDLNGTSVSATKDTANGIVYGPYLRSIPQIGVGARKGSNGIAASDAAGVAWIYDAGIGTISANAAGNDSSG